MYQDYKRQFAVQDAAPRWTQTPTLILSLSDSMTWLHNKKILSGFIEQECKTFGSWAFYNFNSSQEMNLRPLDPRILQVQQNKFKTFGSWDF